QIGRAWREWHARDAGLVNDVLKGWTVLAVSVVDHVLPGLQEAPVCHGDIARDLDHPPLVGMRRYPCHMHLPTGQVDKKEHAIRHQPCLRPDFCREAVRRHKDVHMYTDELPPSRPALCRCGGVQEPCVAWSRRTSEPRADGASQGLYPV